MSIKGIVSADSGGVSVTSFTQTYTGTAIALNDIILILTVNSAGGASNFTDPSGGGFTDAGTVNAGLADSALYFSGVNVHLIAKVAAAGDVGNPTWTMGMQFAGRITQTIIVLSGRNYSSLATVLGNFAVTASVAGSTLPITYSMTGLTTLAGDDLLAFVLIAPTSSISVSYTASITGFTTEANQRYTGGNSYTVATITLGDLDISSPGPTGFLNAMLSQSSGSITANFRGFLISIPASSASLVPSPVKSTGGVLLSNGHSVLGDVIKAFGNTSLAMFPLVWAIKRRRKLSALARKRSARTL